jgi:hypothetical protein
MRYKPLTGVSSISMFFQQKFAIFRQSKADLPNSIVVNNDTNNARAKEIETPKVTR